MELNMKLTIEIEPEEAAVFLSEIAKIQYDKAQEISKMVLDSSNNFTGTNWSDHFNPAKNPQWVFGPDAFYGPGLLDSKKSPADIWNETYTKWINAIKDQHADDKE
jgi:hypothetical protein